MNCWPWQVWPLAGVAAAVLGAAAATLFDEPAAAILIGVAAAATLRRRGWSAPGSATGSGLVLVTTFLALENPAHRYLPFFAYGPDDRWPASARLWWLILLAAGLALVAACTELKPVRRR